MPHRFAYSTNAYTKWPLERAIADIRWRGFDGVEILADVPHAWPEAADVATIRHALADFPVSNLNANTTVGLDPSGIRPSLIDPDPATRRQKVQYVKRAIELARALGAPSVCTATGPRPPRVSSRQAQTLLSDALEQILAAAETKPDVRVGIEYEPGFFVGGMRSALRLIEELDHPLLGVNLDLGHAQCEGENLAEVIEAFGPRIWNIHIEDIRKRVHEHLIPGHGDIDFTRVRRALDRIRYDRFITLELYPYKDDPGGAGSQGLAHLRPIFG
ncbi:MAG: sugar phosphate isomerase/epimerase [Planctomycetes bacterium]|nr:sugar phosphate isomerase/epimerase [Planctomycetota bacterium]